MRQRNSKNKVRLESNSIQLRVNRDDVAHTIRVLVARLVGKKPSELLLDESLLEQGLDSLEVTELVCQLEEHFGLKLDQLVVWDNDSIDSLTDAILGSSGDLVGRSDGNSVES